MIAIVCDCDDTLAPDTTRYLLAQNGIDLETFWSDHNVLVRNGWDPPIAWMTEIISMMHSGKITQDTNQALEKLGSTIVPNKGLMEFIPYIRSIVAGIKAFENANISLEFYIISSGFEAIIRGTPFAHYFEGIFGGTFAEDPQTKKITLIKSCITFTEKTKFLYAINKGIKGAALRENPFLVNKKIAREARRVPFANMIYIGDSSNDVPCFSAVKQNGGQCVGVAGDPTFRTSHELARDRRMTVGPYKGNYEIGGDLCSAIEACVKSIGYSIVNDSNQTQ